MKILLVTYSNFTTTARLAEKLLDRYNVPNSVDEKAAKIIRNKVCQVFSTWKEEFPATENFLTYLSIIEDEEGNMILDEVKYIFVNLW